MRNFFCITFGAILCLSARAEVAPHAELPPPPKKPKWEFSLEAGGVSRNIKAFDRVTEGRAEFNSPLLLQVRAGFGYAFADTFKVSILGTTLQNDFENVSESQFIERPSATSEYELRLRRPVSELVEFRLSVGSQRRLFSRALNFSHFTFDEADVLFWGLGVEGGFFLENNVLLGAMVDLRSLGGGTASNFTVEEGSEVQASLFARKRLGDFWYTGKLFYNFSDQNSFLVKQTEKQTGVSLGLMFVY